MNANPVAIERGVALELGGLILQIHRLKAENDALRAALDEATKAPAKE